MQYNYTNCGTKTRRDSLSICDRYKSGSLSYASDKALIHVDYKGHIFRCIVFLTGYILCMGCDSLKSIHTHTNKQTIKHTNTR